MSLKVLLADDSAAIKKVVQLSLQDFGAEVKSVGSGKDVLDVCRSFHPDIAFVDVLLPHKTGYEVVSELKKDAALKGTPVVMLWSAFMAFDEGKFKASGADEKLEKPFEVSGLRSLVTKLVPKVSGNPIGRHLEFPKIQFDQPIGSVPPTKKTLEPVKVQSPAPASQTSPSSQTSAEPEALKPIDEEWSMASFEEIGTFTGKLDTLKTEAIAEKKAAENVLNTPVMPAAPVLPKPAPRDPSQPKDANADGGTWTAENEWVRKDITSKFKVPIPSEEQEENTVTFQYSESQINDTSFLFKPPTDGASVPPGTQTGVTATGTGTKPAPSEMADVLKPLPAEPATKPASPKGTSGAADNDIPLAANPRSILTDEDMARIREEVRDAVEKAVWKLVPELATQLIKEELQRLLGDDT